MTEEAKRVVVDGSAELPREVRKSIREQSTLRGPLVTNQPYEPSAKQLRRAQRWVDSHPPGTIPPGHIVATLARCQARRKQP